MPIAKLFLFILGHFMTSLGKPYCLYSAAMLSTASFSTGTHTGSNLMLMILTSEIGLSRLSLATFAILSMTSKPSTVSPKTV